MKLDKLKQKIYKLFKSIHTFGIRVVLETFIMWAGFLIINLVQKFMKRRKMYKSIKGVISPVCLRYSTSDEEVYNATFIDNQFECHSIINPKCIIDCGSYIGLSAVWFLNRFPKVKIIAIEPDKENFELGHENLSPYKNRTILLKAAVWPEEKPLIIKKGVYRDGLDWANQIIIPKKSESTNTVGITINALIEQYALTTIDILKIDIERSELYLFSKNTEWLHITKNIVIELHDKECESIFYKALTDYSYVVSKRNDLTFCTNMKYNHDN